MASTGSASSLSLNELIIFKCEGPSLMQGEGPFDRNIEVYVNLNLKLTQVVTPADCGKITPQ